MERENSIRYSLLEKFSFLEGKITIPRNRRMFVETPRESFLKVITYIVEQLGFDQLCTITGLDLGEELQFIYHLAESKGIVLNLKLNVPKKEPIIPSVTGINNGAIFYERELVDLLGARVEGLPPGDRYPLPDDWPAGQYPLRKDWKPEQLTKSKEG